MIKVAISYMRMIRKGKVYLPVQQQNQHRNNFTAVPARTTTQPLVNTKVATWRSKVLHHLQ
jgi:hypothetical protein